jgi:hypoxanthine phosphoribosyltransferase
LNIHLSRRPFLAAEECPASLSSITMRSHHIRDILFRAEDIERRLSALVEEMAEECRTESFAMVGILRGSFMFLADLCRQLNKHRVHPRIDFVTLESYGAGTESSGRVHVAKDFNLDVRGAHVLLVDDILDTGRTLSFAHRHLLEKGATVVKTCALLNKPSRRVVPFEADYVGFTIEDFFVVGYGLDYDSHYRELPYIAKVTFTD